MAKDAEVEQRVQAFLAGRPRKYADADPRALQIQVNGLADMLVLVVKERDRLIAAAQVAESSKLWTRMLTACVVTEGVLIGWLATQLFERLGK